MTATTDPALDVGTLRLVLVAIAALGVVVLLVRRRRVIDGAPPVLLGRVPLAIWLRYAVIGAVLGAAWLWDPTLPPWQHALRLTGIIVVAAPLFTVLRNRRLARLGRPDPTATVAHVRGWVLSKVALVIAALGAELALERQWDLQVAAEIVAVGLFLVAAVAGPLLHERIAGGWRRTGAPGDAGLPLPGVGGLDKGI